MDIHFDFFHVEPVGGRSLPDAFNAISSLADDKRHAVIQQRPYRVSHLSRDRGQRLWTGDIVRYRINNLPGIGAQTDDAIRDIPLGSKEGVTEHACFAFSEPDDVFILQRSRFAIAYFLVSPLMRALSQIRVPWSLVPIPRADAVERLEGATAINNVVVRFARVRNPELVVSDTDGDQQAVKIGNRGVIPRFKIELSNQPGRRGQKLDAQSMIAFAKRMFRRAAGSGEEPVHVDNLRIKGIDADGDILDMKLLE